jgi:hypothetical protein
MMLFGYIRPIEITDAMLVSHSVPENDYPAWSVGTTYAIGARVILVSTHSVYESLVGSNIGNNPATATQWQQVGPTNRWAAFDKARGTVTTSAADTMTIVLTIPDLVSGIGLIDMDCESLHVTMTVDGATVYDKDFPATYSAANVIDYWSWCFESIEPQGMAIMTDVPPFRGAQITITLTKTGGPSVGTVVIGPKYDLGILMSRVSVGFVNKSKKTENAWGALSIRKSGVVDTMRGTLAIENATVDIVKRRMQEVKDIPVLFYSVGNFESMNVYGFPFDAEIEIATPVVSYMSFRIDSLI